MKRYKVVDPKGVLNGETRIAKGELLPHDVVGSQLSAWKRFCQVQEVDVTPKAPKGSQKQEGEGGNDPPKDPEGGKKPDELV